jgi:hypothetical protein
LYNKLFYLYLYLYLIYGVVIVIVNCTSTQHIIYEIYSITGNGILQKIFIKCFTGLNSANENVCCSVLSYQLLKELCLKCSKPIDCCFKSWMERIARVKYNHNIIRALPQHPDWLVQKYCVPASLTQGTSRSSSAVSFL